jgi:hypothetical protein
MPAQSQQQQKLFGLALSVKRGETPRSEASEDVLGIVDSMTEKEIEDFASTSHKGLPPKVEEYIREEVRKHINENIPRMFKVYLGVQNKLRKLEDEQKKMLGQFKDEKDPKKKRNILDKMKDGTVRLKKVRANLADIEREYINKAAYDTSYSENIKISKDDMEKLHSDGEVEVDGEKVTFEEGKKRFRQQDGIGKAKYTISYHDGKQKHKDGSDFFGIQIFKNKKDLETFRNALLKKGYIEESINEAKIYKVIFAGMQEKDAKDFFTMVDRSPKIKAMTKDSGVFKVGNEVTIRFGVSSKQELEIIKKVAKLEGLKIVKIDESVNEGIEPQIKKIAYFTGTRPEAVEDFVSKHALNFTKLLKYVEKGGLPQRMELVSALAGRPNNPKQKKIIKQFQESVNEAYDFKPNKNMNNLMKGRKIKNVVYSDKLGFAIILDNGKFVLIRGHRATPGSEKELELESVVNEDANMNKKVKQLLDKNLKELTKGKPNHQFAVMHILMGALSDANFHSEAKQVAKLFPRAKYEGDPMAAKDVEEYYHYELGPDVANICKWDGKDIVDAIGFYVSMTIGRPVGEKVEKLVESVNEDFNSKDRTFEKVYSIFDKKDYFNAKGLAKVQIGNFERALQKNDKGAQQILDKFKGDMDKAKDYIIQVITDRKKEDAFNQYKAFKAAVDSIQKGNPIYGAVDLVKSRIHNNSQKYTIALYSALRNQKFTKWKDIHNDIDSLIK